MAESDYERGFLAGFKLAWEQLRGSYPVSIPTPFYPTLPQYSFSTTGCSVCGISFTDGPQGYVCSNPNCPTAIRAS